MLFMLELGRTKEDEDEEEDDDDDDDEEGGLSLELRFKVGGARFFGEEEGWRVKGLGRDMGVGKAGEGGGRVERERGMIDDNMRGRYM